ncbi:Uncharacterised protein [Enterobacter cloacae]|uniref:Uncharacterized protein n=1 Tax=Enterobacter cloacae TaxID=550 RepID=A0A377M4M8_ENTCL|nr:Uncharacterised protein [Enterobacter cloacae]
MYFSKETLATNSRLAGTGVSCGQTATCGTYRTIPSLQLTAQ